MHISYPLLVHSAKCQRNRVPSLDVVDFVDSKKQVCSFPAKEFLEAWETTVKITAAHFLPSSHDWESFPNVFDCFQLMDSQSLIKLRNERNFPATKALGAGNTIFKPAVPSDWEKQNFFCGLLVDPHGLNHSSSRFLNWLELARIIFFNMQNLNSGTVAVRQNSS